MTKETIFFGLNYAYHDQNISINTLNWAKSVPLIVEIGQIQPNLRSNLIGCDQKGRIRTNSSELIKNSLKTRSSSGTQLEGNQIKFATDNDLIIFRFHLSRISLFVTEASSRTIWAASARPASTRGSSWSGHTVLPRAWNIWPLSGSCTEIW